MPRIIEKPTKWGLKGSRFLQNSWNMWPGALQAASRAQGYFGSAKMSYRIFFLNPFGATWSTFGAILAPTWFWSGSPNRPVLKTIDKNEKNEVQETGWTNHDFLIDFSCQNGRLEIVKKKVSALYLLQNMSLLGDGKHRENWCQKRSPKLSNMDRLGGIGSDFFDFWLLSKIMIFLRFCDRQKIGQQSTQMRF